VKDARVYNIPNANLLFLNIILNAVFFGVLYRRRFESAPPRVRDPPLGVSTLQTHSVSVEGAPYKSVTGNTAEESSAERIEFFEGVNIKMYVPTSNGSTCSS